MNFTCESCQRRFAISDEKVRGNAVRVRCKGCGNLITVGPLPEQPSDEQRTRMVAMDDLERLRAKAAEPASSPWEEEPTRAVPPSSQATWFAMVHGKQEGPFDLGALSEKISAREISGRTYLWKKGLPDWKRATDLPEIARLLSPPGPGLSERPAPRRRGTAADPDAAASRPIGVARPTGPAPQRISTQELDAVSLFSDLELSKVVRMPQPDLSDIARAPERAGEEGEPGPEDFPDELGAAPPVGKTGPGPMRRPPRSARPLVFAAAALLLAGAVVAAAKLGIPTVARTSADGIGAWASKFRGEAPPAKPSVPAAARQPAAAAAEAKPPAPAAAPAPPAKKEEAKPAGDKESDAPRVVRGGRRLRPSEIERAGTTTAPWFRACLDQERKHNPNYSAGRVVVRWTLANSGAVKTASLDRKDVEDAPIGECIKAKAKLLRIAAPGEETVLEIPVNLGGPM